MAVARPDEESEVAGWAGVIAGHLVSAEREGEVLAAVRRGGRSDAAGKRAVEVGRLRHDSPHRVSVRDPVAPREADAVQILFRHQPALARLGRPGERDSG